MRDLIYVPIIHMSADLGSVGKHVDKRGVAGFGEEFWKSHRETISRFWDSIREYFRDMDVKGFKVYQDGLVANGVVGEKIIMEGVRSGSKNYQIVNDLLKRGGILVRTEDFSLVKQERDHILDMTRATTVMDRLIAYSRYKLGKGRLLRKRDRYIAQRIQKTLEDGETGILFLGAYHTVIPRIPKHIRVTEVKQVNKVRDYQRFLIRVRKNKEEWEKLADYLVSPVS